MAPRPKRLLVRGEDSLSVAAPVWSNTIVLATRWGWQPERGAMHFLAPNFAVTERDAISLANTIGKIWQALSDDPFGITLDPPIKIERVMDIGAFCLGGAFIVRHI